MAFARFYIRILVEMEDLINTTWEDKDGRKSMSKNNAKGLSSLRQKLRKYKKEEELEEHFEKFRQNPDAADDDDDKEKEDEDENDSDAESSAR